MVPSSIVFKGVRDIGSSYTTEKKIISFWPEVGIFSLEDE